MSKTSLWITWVTAVSGLATVLGMALPDSESASPLSRSFLPGDTSHGHYQIELKCSACHEQGGEVREQSCLDCHAAELKQARDTHPATKFRDPTKAALLEKLDVRSCITCHTEHEHERTNPMGVTLPNDYCWHCHDTVADDRPSHAGLTFDSCSTAGCHNYHDNTALYENFLTKHAHEDDVLDDPVVALLRSVTDDVTSSVSTRDSKRLTIDDHDAFESRLDDETVLIDWEQSAHAHGGVNCSGCHQQRNDEGELAAWSDSVSHEACGECHSREVDGFLAGHHGMRLAIGLEPMTPGEARLPMKSSTAHQSLTCNSCHPAHRYDTRTAAVESCASCHDDDHTRAYFKSSHFELWKAELTGNAAAGTGVSCATCHMPRTESDSGKVFVNHNQNDNLRPNEKMVRSVCMNCHGLQFTLDALADPLLKETCFSTKPSTRVKSIDMAVEWFESRSRGRQKGSARSKQTTAN